MHIRCKLSWEGDSVPRRKATAKTRRGFGQVTTMRSGRLQARYTGPDLALHTAPSTFEDRDAATSWLLAERRLIEDDRWTPPRERLTVKRVQRITFGDYSKTWISTRKTKGKPLADRTRNHYEDLLERFILPTFAKASLTSITPEMVDLWYESVASGRPTYRAHAYGLLRTILNTAVDRGLITTANPAKVRGGGTTKARHKVTPASLAELSIIVAGMPERRRMMVQLAAWCGLRFGELAELRRKDVDLPHRVIKIRRGVVRVKITDDGDPNAAARIERRVKGPKTDAGIRDVPIPPHLIEDLQDHLKHHALAGRDGLLFPGGGDNHLTSSTFYGRESALNRDKSVKRKGHGWYEARRLAGRPDLHFHDLRHTGLTNAAVAGATIAELMALAGHSTPGAAMRYQHAAEDRMQDLASRLSAMATASADT
jgi:integrase